MPLLMLANYWKPIAIAVALAATFAYRALLIHQRDAARSETASLSMQIADLKSGEDACEGAVARQNAAVITLASASPHESSTAPTPEPNVTAAITETASHEALRTPARRIA